MTPTVTLALIDCAKTLLMALFLLWHRQHRKFREDRRVGMNLWGFLDHNITEIVLGAAIAPSLLSLAKLLPGG